MGKKDINFNSKFILLFLILLITFVFCISFISATDYQIKVTEEHPFFVTGKWISASELKVGDKLTTIDGKTATITKLTPVHSEIPIPVYNLEALPFNDFVVAGGVVVHNSNKPKEFSCYQCGNAQNCPFRNIQTGQCGGLPAGGMNFEPKAGQIVEFIFNNENKIGIVEAVGGKNTIRVKVSEGKILEIPLEDIKVVKDPPNFERDIQCIKEAEAKGDSKKAKEIKKRMLEDSLNWLNQRISESLKNIEKANQKIEEVSGKNSILKSQGFNDAEIKIIKDFFKELGFWYETRISEKKQILIFWFFIDFFNEKILH